MNRDLFNSILKAKFAPTVVKELSSVVGTSLQLLLSTPILPPPINKIKMMMLIDNLFGN